MRRTRAWIAVLLLFTTASVAAAQAAPARPVTSQAQQAGTEPEPVAQPVNVRIDLSIVQERDEGTPDTRSVSMVVADGAFGRVRAAAQSRQALGPAAVQLNVDARPRIVPTGVVRLDLTIEHTPLPVPPSGEGPPHTATQLNESLSVHLRSGVPLVVSQASDPITGRKTTVEVTATVLK